MTEALFQLGPLKDFLALLLWTGQLTDERPASAIVIAPAGTGKTTLLEALVCEQAAFVGDLTSRSLSFATKKSENATHILLGDMLSMFGHKGSTVKLTMRLISQMTGEYLKHDPFSGEEIKPRQIGLITAIPPVDYAKNRKKIEAGGFGTRFMEIRYSYKPSTITSIHNWIMHNRYSDEVKPFTMINPGKVEISVPKEVSGHIKDFGLTLRHDPVGFRVHRHLRALVKANARRDGRTEVRISDLDKIKDYCDFFSSDGKEI